EDREVLADDQPDVAERIPRQRADDAAEDVARQHVGDQYRLRELEAGPHADQREPAGEQPRMRADVGREPAHQPDVVRLAKDGFGLEPRAPGPDRPDRPGSDRAHRSTRRCHYTASLRVTPSSLWSWVR